MRKDPEDALEFNAKGPLVVLDYTNEDMNAIRYFNPRTNYTGTASVANVKKLHLMPWFLLQLYHLLINKLH